ncbi:efflux RND transporter permease subunit, partial [bacterium]|nr:efflux RND transporter permease subunit [bacterium]
MLNKIVAYFAHRHLLTNLILISILVGGIFSWTKIKKEEMPDVTFDTVRISANYPGATAQEVEYFVTRELEKVLEGLDGVYRIVSTASQGTTSLTVELEQDYPNKEEVITEIRNTVLDVKLPVEVRDEPSVRVFKTSKKAIIDVALIYTEKHLLDVSTRQILQQYAVSLENQLKNLPEINSVNKSGYFQEEIQINVDPQKLIKYNIPLSKVSKVVSEGHSRQPAGNIETKNEPKVTINAQLDTIDKLNKVYVQAGFEGQAISLADVADVQHGFDRGKNIVKVNGHEAVMFNVVKNSSAGILDSVDAVKMSINNFKSNYLKDALIDLVVLDDESLDVRNRLSIIAMNGGIGFVLVFIMLFLFLDKRSGLWVGFGIPFTICFTLVCSLLLGYTINNITLAAVIIVMGMVVDDAIVVAENITRLRRAGMNMLDSAVNGTSQVFLPVLASIVTTCVAFVPLYFFSGRFGKLNSFIPPIIFLMLGASLFESLIILPGHMILEAPFLNRLLSKFNNKKKKTQSNGHWFDKVETLYGDMLSKILSYKFWIFLSFICLLLFSGWVMSYKMKFVMFPNEETREIVVSGYANKDFDRYETADVTKKIEEYIKPYIGKEVVGIRTEIAKSRRGGAVEENRFSMVIEIVPKEKRKKSADDLVLLWKPFIDNLPGLDKVTVQKSRWGQSSGSAIEIIVQENNDERRESSADKLAELMKGSVFLMNVEIERPIQIPEYKISFQREKVKRLSISPVNITSTFRASLEGTVLYELPNGDDEVDVRLSV